jgi:hypothetical protein
LENSRIEEMTTIYCEMPHCIYNKEGVCQAEAIDLRFGIVMQLAGRGAEGFVRCLQLKTQKDLEKEK